MDASNKKHKVTLGTFDLIKGIVIIIVVMGHALSKYKMRNNIMLPFPLNILAGVISSGAMPMFFLLAGYSFKSRPVNKMLKKSFKELMKPYFIVMIVIVILYPICHFMLDGGIASIKTTVQYMMAFLLGLPEPGKMLFNLQLKEAMVVWFLLSLFIAINLMNFILKIKNTYIRNLSVIGITVIGYILSIYEFIYFCIPQGMLGLGFCYVGYLTKKYSLFEKDNKIVWLFIIVTAVIHTIYGNFNLAYSTYTHGYFSYIGAAVSGVILMYMGLLIQNAKFPLSSIIKKAGMYSYWIICIHSVELTAVPWHSFARSLDFPEIIVFAMEIILKAILISFFCAVIKKLIKLKYTKRLSSGI